MPHAVKLTVASPDTTQQRASARCVTHLLGDPWTDFSKTPIMW